MRKYLLIFFFVIFLLYPSFGLEERYIVYSCNSVKLKINEKLGFSVTYDSKILEYCKAEKDAIVKAAYIPNDEKFGMQWYLNSISVQEAWNYTTGSPEIVVAVIDSGIDFNHRDLSSSLWTNSDEIPNNGIDDDGNGYVDDYYGYDFVNEDSIPMDDNGHGTMVSGIIAATINNSVGIAGIAQVKIMVLKVLDENGFGYESDLAEAIRYAVDNGAKIISMSLGGDEYVAALKNACDYARSKGAILIAAAGNDGSEGVEYPAAFKSVVAVGALDKNDKLASFSNYGEELELVAPGVDIFTTLPGNAYGYIDGTSASVPQVSGVASLILSVNPELSGEDVRKILRDSADDLGFKGKDVFYGYGKVNASRALSLTPLRNSTSIKFNEFELEMSLTSPILRGDGILSIHWKGNSYVKLLDGDTRKTIWREELSGEGEKIKVLRNLSPGGYLIIGGNSELTTLFFLVDEKQPKFKTNFTISSKKLPTGYPLVVTFCVENSGVGGYYAAELFVDNTFYDLKLLYVEENSTACDNFTLRINESGIYVVKVNEWSTVVEVVEKYYRMEYNLSAKKLYVGENLRIHVCVENLVDLEVMIPITIFVDGEIVNFTKILLSPKSEACFNFSYLFVSPGNHSVAVNDLSPVNVSVLESFNPVLYVEREEFSAFPPFEVIIPVVVENKGNGSGSFELKLNVNNVTVKKVILNLMPGQTVRINLKTTLPNEGFYNISVNNFTAALVRIFPKAELRVIPEEAVLGVGELITFNAILFWSNGTYDNVTDKVTWYVDCYELSKVNGSLFIAKSNGSCKIIAKYFNLEASARVFIGDNDEWDDEIEMVISKYVDFDPVLETPNEEVLINAIVSAVNSYFFSENKEEILSDIIILVNAYFKMF